MNDEWWIYFLFLFLFSFLFPSNSRLNELVKYCRTDHAICRAGVRPSVHPSIRPSVWSGTYCCSVSPDHTCLFTLYSLDPLLICEHGYFRETRPPGFNPRQSLDLVNHLILTPMTVVRCTWWSHSLNRTLAVVEQCERCDWRTKDI